MEAQHGQQQDQSNQPGRITVTYEALFDMVVREKGRDELQALNENFFSELVSYLIEKKSMLAVLGPEEKEKTARQLQNINRLVKELYERREKKIISLALARSRAGVDIIDTSALLADEKALFDGLVSQLDAFRDGVLNSLLVAKLPTPQKQHQQTQQTQTGAETLAAASRVITSASLSAISGTNITDKGRAGTAEEHNQIAAATGENESSDSATAATGATKLVRFLHPVPRFVGSELEVYGPFDQEDMANLPREIAEVLIARGRAEEVAQA
ncbi:DNA replication complex GINS family protein [Candidatus Woesearchaeota archaeon]|nr:DNA replication complex GINS family protein [Candidatus Woesearchaeota archaeon]